jgi:hypothetical protein
VIAQKGLLALLHQTLPAAQEQVEVDVTLPLKAIVILVAEDLEESPAEDLQKGQGTKRVLIGTELML